MIRDRDRQRRLLALRCSGCAYRPGTPAFTSEATRQGREDAARLGAPFMCHKWIDVASDEAAILADPSISSHGGLCAGHVFRTFDDEDAARWLAGGRLADGGSTWVEASFYCAWSYRQPCGHLHRRPIDAWSCGIQSNDPHFEVRYFDSWPLLQVAPGPMESHDDHLVLDDGRCFEWAHASPLNEAQEAELQAQLAAELPPLDLDMEIGCAP